MDTTDALVLVQITDAAPEVASLDTRQVTYLGVGRAIVCAQMRESGLLVDGGLLVVDDNTVILVMSPGTNPDIVVDYLVARAKDQIIEGTVLTDNA